MLTKKIKFNSVFAIPANDIKVKPIKQGCSGKKIFS